MAKKPKPGEWKHSVGEVPLELTAYERPDRGFAIYTRIWDGRKYKDKRFLCETIRDEKGRIVPAAQLKAQELANKRHEAAVAGVEEKPKGPLTLARGFWLLLHSDGKFPADTPWKAEVRRYGVIVRQVLGKDLLCKQIRHAHYRKLWRHLATDFSKDGGGGVPTADKVCGVLRSLIVWLQQEGHIEPGTGLPAPHWKQMLREEFAAITNAPVPKPKRPRYTPEESVKIWHALPQADPRVEIAAEIGAELRLGQVPRSRRSDLLPHGGHPIGAAEVHGRGKKLGEVVVLTDEQRAAIYRALSRGYLREFEAAYQKGKLKDYYLIPGGRLRNVKTNPVASLQNANVAWGNTGLRKAWRKLERIARVEHVEGRNWYGLRRRAADDAEDVEKDARVLNRLGAWKHTTTREGYQEEGRTEIAEKAAGVRSRIRPKKAADNGLQPQKGP